MKFLGGENGRNPVKNLPRPRFVHHETHMEGLRRELGTPAVGGERLTACATRSPYDVKRQEFGIALENQLRFEFASTMCDRMEEDDNFLNRWVFSDEATFLHSGRVKTHIAIIRGRENPHLSYELERVSPKVNVWCGISRYKLYGSFMFGEETVRSGPYLDM